MQRAFYFDRQQLRRAISVYLSRFWLESRKRGVTSIICNRIGEKEATRLTFFNAMKGLFGNIFHAHSEGDVHDAAAGQEEASQSGSGNGSGTDPKMSLLLVSRLKKQSKTIRERTAASKIINFTILCRTVRITTATIIIVQNFFSEYREKPRNSFVQGCVILAQNRRNLSVYVLILANYSIVIICIGTFVYSRHLYVCV